MRLLRLIHPFLAYSGEHLAAIPLRGLLALPIAAIMLAATEGARVMGPDPVRILVLLVALVGAWLMMFVTGLIIGTLGLFLERSIAIFDVWWGMFAVVSGYLVPVALLPDWLRAAARWLPFRYMLGFPVELLIGRLSRGQALEQLAIQWLWVVGLLGLCKLAWRAGLKRFEAYGA